MNLFVAKTHQLVVRSALLSFILFFSFVLLFADSLIKNEIREFDLMAAHIDEYKHNILLMGLLIEAKVNDDHDDVPEFPMDGYFDSRIFNFKNTPLNDEEIVVLNVSRYISNFLPGFFSNSNILLYYRSYSGMKVFTNREMKNATLDENVFESERCRTVSVCTLYSTAVALKDRMLISGIYTDAITKHLVITLSSPIYKKNKIVGDLAIDLYLKNSEFLFGKDISLSKTGNYNVMVIEDQSYPLHQFSYSKEYIADNGTIFIYKLPFTKLIIDFIWAEIGLLLLMFYILWKLSELKEKQLKLTSIESVINRDELTGLYNRSILKDKDLLNTKQKSSMSVIVIDGDKLKSINDNFGHHIGDEAIKQIAHGMRMTFRESDYLVRLGGDEFLVILPNCDVSVAQRLAIKLQENISAVAFSKHFLSIEVSAGVTAVLQQETLATAIKRADTLLYSQKMTKDMP